MKLEMTREQVQRLVEFSDKCDCGYCQAARDWLVLEAAVGERDKRIAELEAQLSGIELAKEQPCGCIICTCEDSTHCQGCGAKNCGTHPVGQIPNPVYVKQPLLERAEKAEVECRRLSARDCMATVELCYDNGKNPFQREKLRVVDVGVADNVYVVASATVEKLQAENAALRKAIEVKDAFILGVLDAGLTTDENGLDTNWTSDAQAALSATPDALRDLDPKGGK